jgi:hypothetical protein
MLPEGFLTVKLFFAAFSLFLLFFFLPARRSAPAALSPAFISVSLASSLYIVYREERKAILPQKRTKEYQNRLVVSRKNLAA